MADALAPYLGYLGSLLLMIGLLVNSDLKFRIWNGLGCFIFIVYATIIQAMPVLLTNVILFAINCFYFVKIMRRKESFDTVIVQPTDVLLQKFLDFYAAEIELYFPAFDRSVLDKNTTLVLLRDLVIAAVFSFYLDENGTAYVTINFTAPKYRDFKLGKFLFNGENSTLKTLGIKKIVYHAVGKKSHASFLLRSGFTAVQGTVSGMEKTI